MDVASAYKPPGEWPDDACSRTVTLDYDRRYRRRIQLTDDQGGNVLLHLDRPRLLQDGGALVLSDGTYLRICAAAEDVLDIAAADANDLARLAWHLGNRHVPVQILDGQALRIRADHVLRDMLERLGAKVTQTHAPFSPEQGAYGDHHDERD